MASAEIALRSSTSMAEKVDYCRLLADSGLLPDAYRGKPANVLYAVEYGETIGVPPMAAITGIHIIKGKPSASAGLVGALVRKAGHKLRVRGNDTSARAVIIRADDPDFEYVSEWTLERAVTAKLCTLKDGKPYARDSKGDPTSWEKYPAAMLKHRAVTEVARDACEEVLFGLHYTPEELGADVNEDGEPVITVQQEPQLTPQDAADAVVRKAEREMVDIAPRNAGQRNPFDPDFDLPPMPGSASARPATDAQLTKLVILVKEKRGVEGNDPVNRALRLEILGDKVRRKLTSGRDLTLREAQELIESLMLEPNYIADAEVVEGEESPDMAQLGADFAAEIESATSEPDLAAIAATVDGAVEAGQLTPDQGNELLAATQAKRSGWSHRTAVGAGLNA